MMAETWCGSERDKKRLGAYLTTQDGQRNVKRWHDQMYRAMEWRIANEGYVPPPEELKKLEEWRKNRDK